jgi:hypothetical protein
VHICNVVKIQNRNKKEKHTQNNNQLKHQQNHFAIFLFMQLNLTRARIFLSQLHLGRKQSVKKQPACNCISRHRTRTQKMTPKIYPTQVIAANSK